MTSQGTASGRFTRAIQQRNLFAAEIALREMGGRLNIKHVNDDRACGRYALIIWHTGLTVCDAATK